MLTHDAPLWRVLAATTPSSGAADSPAPVVTDWMGLHTNLHTLAAMAAERPLQLALTAGQKSPWP
ncbi:hypothetical protein PC116_g11805 [Phytophthora cactorum]|uniref:Uncharacterized protein n=1 Tax=Phytophthora cactorum TaxID=29920 RepID=A0A8T1KXK7_9STRA|nr:hypothetical protein Pcac1_g10324 [Phytophthora cactorum]KAG2893682.1 hypothetical protein PC114_g16165 [Phytophthora cactorum]KAG2924053.1 hypothetical protein PC117_g15509 [Phytophthora cactorum]KAG3004251.1 hypothetical protein PC119_g15678 [Phytophthora cactorum]KAG3019475.1 hypothetical protein PC120_g9837 [Phytophthora cactorum]